MNTKFALGFMDRLYNNHYKDSYGSFTLSTAGWGIGRIGGLGVIYGLDGG